MADPRPNKALRPLPLPDNEADLERVNRWNAIVQEGLRVPWLDTKPERQNQIPSNHNSVQDHLDLIVKNLRKGQDSNHTLIVDQDLLNLWPELHISPLGAVAKPGVAVTSNVRIIHDLSYPTGDSVNNYTEVRGPSCRISYPGRDGASGHCIKDDISGHGNSNDVR